MTFLTMPWRYAFRYRMRAALTITSLVIALGLYVLLNSLLGVLTARDQARESSTRIIVQNAAGIANLLPAYVGETVASMTGVVAVNPQILFAGTYRDGGAENAFGQAATDPETWGPVFAEYTVWPGSLEEWAADPTSFIAGGELIRRYGWQIGDTIQLRGSLIPVDLTITLRGVFHGRNEHLIFFHRRMLDGTWIDRAGLVGVFAIRTIDADRVPEVVEGIKERFQNGDVDVLAMPENQFLLQFLEMLGDVKSVIRMVTVVALLAALLTVTNAIMMSVRERVYEVGVMRTVGFQRSHLFVQLALEAMFIAVIGGIAGTALAVPIAFGMVKLLSHSPAAGLVFNFRIPARILAEAFAIALGMGAIAGIVPGIQYGRIGIVRALRRL